MEPRTTTLTQLFLRLALSVCFLSAVADRLGFWGTRGSVNVAWGDWQNFVAYSNMVNSFVPPAVGGVLAVVATALEVIFGLMLLTGFKVRWAAYGSGALLLTFALTMTISFGVKPSLDYSVWSAAAGSFLLAGISSYPYSLDEFFSKR